MRTRITRSQYRAICQKQGADGKGGGGVTANAGARGSASGVATPIPIRFWLGGGGAGGGGGTAGAGGSNDEAGAASGHGHTSGDDDDADADAPSELLVPLLEEWREVLVKHVLTRLDPTDCALLAQVGKPWRAVVEANKLPRAGKAGAVSLKVEEFVGSAEMLAWAKDNGCPWEEETCAAAAAGGHLEVLQWAREHGCAW
jgi:hypothetical protein